MGNTKLQCSIIKLLLEINAYLVHQYGTVCVRHICLLNYRRDLFKTDIFRKFMIPQSRQSALLLLIHSQKLFLTKKAKVKNWPCCRKWGTREANIVHALPLLSAWDRTVDFNFHFLNYTCQKSFISYIHADSDPFISKRNYPASAVVSTFCIVMFNKLL